jgi:rSAM/selenodomain-associated transferase 1
VTATATLIVIAKEPLPGRVKTRLTPPFTPVQAAALAEAALADTLQAVAEADVARRVLALDGAPGPWLPSSAGFEVIPQHGGGLDERLAACFEDVYDGSPMVLIGMDTPQVTPPLLESALAPLVGGEADAAIGPAEDGGFWLLGLRAPDPSLLLGVPMSVASTGAVQLARLRAAGLRLAVLPELTDVDTVISAERVVATAPGTRFSAAFRAASAQASGSRGQASGPVTVTSVP